MTAEHPTMNASLKSVPAQGRSASARAADSLARVPAGQDVVAIEGVLEMPGEMALHHGGRLAGVHVAWRIVGPANAPVVCALGGISANRYVCTTEDPRQAWWGQIVGAGCPLNADSFRVLSFDFLGGSGDTTGPAQYGSAHSEGDADGATASPFPSISTYDQAVVLAALIDHLGIKSLRAIAGGSYGGMVALAFGERYPERVAQLLVIGAADRAHPLSTAWRSVQRRVVKFAVDCGRSKEGLQLARALAMSTYRSSEEFSARFGGAASQGEDGFVFPVEEYLYARGADWADRYKPESFLCLSESIDLHRVDASRIFVPTAAVAIREDQLVPLTDVRTMVARLPAGRLHEISSIYGHDAFLKESEQLRPIFHAAIGSPVAGSQS
jgi:homoserine O-acetyltransferase/O-succinyltransferase